jgi:hypothetical protein
MNSLELFTALQLTTIEARSKEEAKAKIYSIEEDQDDSVEAITYASPFRQKKL